MRRLGAGTGELWAAWPLPNSTHPPSAPVSHRAMGPCPILQKEALRPGEGTRTSGSCLAIFQLSSSTGWVPCCPGASLWPRAQTSGGAAVGESMLAERPVLPPSQMHCPVTG